MDFVTKIIEEQEETDKSAEVDAYMKMKDQSLQQRRRFSTSELKNAPNILHPWKIHPPSFFEVAEDEKENDKEEEKEDEDSDSESDSEPKNVTEE